MQSNTLRCKKGSIGLFNSVWLEGNEREGIGFIEIPIFICLSSNIEGFGEERKCLIFVNYVNLSLVSLCPDSKALLCLLFNRLQIQMFVKILCIYF